MALGAPDHSAAHGGTDDLIGSEGALEDQGESSGDGLIVDNQEDQSHQDVDTGHDGNNDLSHAADDLHAAEHDGSQSNGDHDAAGDGRNVEGIGQSGGHEQCLHRARHQ